VPSAPQTPSKPLRESDLHTGNDHEGHKDLSEEFRKATIPVPKIYTQEQVDQMLKLASAGINITVERVEGKEGKPEKEEEKHDSPRSLRATPYVAPPSISNDMMKVEMGKSIILSSLKGYALKKWGNQVKGYEANRLDEYSSFKYALNKA
jgi:hypothetical protein